MKPWQEIARGSAPDGTEIELRRRDEEYLIVAGGYDLMSSHDERSSKALAELGCAHVRHKEHAHVLVGGLGMGFTLRAALDAVSPASRVEVAELVPAIVDWNRGPLGDRAERPLDDPRVEVYVGDARRRIAAARRTFDAILLDVDNGPDALAHAENERLYADVGLGQAWNALCEGGVLAVWSFSDDPAFTRRLHKRGFSTEVHRVSASRKGRGRRHVIWIARRLEGAHPRPRGPRKRSR